MMNKKAHTIIAIHILALFSFGTIQPEAHAAQTAYALTSVDTLSADYNTKLSRDELIARSLGLVVRNRKKGLIGYGADYRVPQLTYILHMIPHGETPNNIQKRYQDDLPHKNNQLNKTGYQQSGAGVKRWWDIFGEDFMRNPDVYVFVCSASVRTQQTYAVYRNFIKNQTGIDIMERCSGGQQTDPQLNERNFGNWAGKTMDEVRRIPDIGDAEYKRAKRDHAGNNFVYSSRDGTIRDGESFLDGMKRIHDWMIGHNETYRGKKVFAFGHGDIQQAASILFRTERVRVRDGFIQRHELRTANRGHAEYIGGTVSDRGKRDIPGVLLQKIPARVIAIDDIANISAHVAETYRKDIERFLINLRHIHEAYESARTDDAREHMITLRQTFLETLDRYALRMPQINDALVNKQALRDLRAHHARVYREIIAANQQDDTARLTELNREAMQFNYAIMCMSVERAANLLTHKSNWMAAILLLESAMHRAEQLKAETFFRDFRTNVRAQKRDQQTALDRFVQTIDLGDLELTMRASDAKLVTVRRVGWKVVANRLREIKSFFTKNVTIDDTAYEKISAMLEQLAEQYRPEGAPDDRQIIAAAFLQIKTLLEGLPLSEKDQGEAVMLVDLLIDVVGDEKIKLAVPVTFDDEYTRIKSECDIISSAEHDIDTLNARLATVSFLIARLKEARPLSAEEQVLFKDYLTECEEWLDRGIVPEKGSAAQKIKEAQRIVAQGVTEPAQWERIRGFIEGTKQDPGIYRLLTQRAAYCRNHTIYNAQKRLYEAYREWLDTQVLESLRDVQRHLRSNLTAAFTAMAQVDDIMVTGPHASLYTSVRQQIDTIRQIVESTDKRKVRELDTLIASIEKTLLKNRSTLPRTQDIYTPFNTITYQAA